MKKSRYLKKNLVYHYPSMVEHVCRYDWLGNLRVYFEEAQKIFQNSLREKVPKTKIYFKDNTLSFRENV